MSNILKLRRPLMAERNQTLSSDFATDMEAILALQKEVGPWIACLGSSAFRPGGTAYSTSREMGRLIVTRLQLALATGHGPYLMEAFNLGAYEAKGTSVGIGLEGLPSEQKLNKWCTHSVICKTLLARQHGLLSGACAVVVAPEGSIGTVFEVGHQIIEMRRHFYHPDTPIVIIDNSGLWQKLLEWMDEELVGRGLWKNSEFAKLIRADSAEKACRILLDCLF
jgi:predicted Rossmann-fold nucleotide-binding protein